MTLPVATFRPWADYVPVVTGQPISGSQLQQLDALSMYVRGHGSVLVPHILLNESISASSNATYRFKVRAHVFPHQRMWLVALRGATAGGTAVVTDTASTAHNVAFGASQGGIGSPVLEAVASPAQTVQEISVNIAAPSTTAVTVVSLACVDVPRASLASGGTELGVDLGTLVAGRPIQASRAGFSLGEVAKGVSDVTGGMLNAGRRVGMFQWASAAGFTFSTGSFVNMFTDGAGTPGAPLLGRKLYSGDTARNVTFAVYGQALVAASTGELKVSASHSGGSVTMTIGTTLQWYGVQTLDVDCEDPTTTDGRQGGAWDNAQCGGRRASGSGNVIVYAISGWEDLAP